MQNVTVTETKTITGPPNLVLPAQNTGFRSYQAPEVRRSTINPSEGERRYDGKESFTKEEFISHYGTRKGMHNWEKAKDILVAPEDTKLPANYNPETLQETWKQKLDNTPEMSYERDEESPLFNEVILRSIQTAEESNTTPLLATIEKEAEATEDGEGIVSGIKSINTK